jgi:uncharacterized protein (DUF433 family)
MAARIMIEPGKRSGQPCVRALCITVWDVLSWLAAGMTEQEILDDYPELEPDDFRAVCEFAASGFAPNWYQRGLISDPNVLSDHRRRQRRL